MREMLMKASFQRILHQMCTYKDITKILVAMRLGVTPVPIPNTMVKT